MIVRAAFNGPKALVTSNVSHDWGSLLPGAPTSAVIAFTPPEGLVVLGASAIGIHPANTMFAPLWAPGLGGLWVQGTNLTALPIEVGVMEYLISMLDPSASSPDDPEP